ncbi:FUSC family protein [Streptomyces cyaneofuscatus]|uniref:FUSC family protein n=1 Tax=Streptomyces cyaneofuscatus TaxID=66883 RepID=UPI003811978D
MAYVTPTGQERATVLRRAVRIVGAVSVVFYPLLYGAELPIMALYAFFAPIAVGNLSQIPGSGRQRASVMLRALPLALALATLGTLLAVDTWAAVGGMLIVGFVLGFAAVAGPRPASVAPGLQLFYILACFPPYAPETLGQRLSGLTIGVLALVVCELLLPDPSAVPYRERLSRALDEAARGAAPGGVAPGKLREIGALLPLASVPPAERPAGPGRTDRALEHGGRAARSLLDQLAALAETPSASADPASAAILHRVAELCSICAQLLRTGTGPKVAGSLEGAMRAFQAERVRLAAGPPGERPPVEVERRRSRVLELAESARTVEITVGIATCGRPTEPAVPHPLFWYAEMSVPRLWARRVLGNVTFRSVLFQNAVRTALGLAAARAVAGSLDLDHGFWVLLAVLTLGHTTVGATWQAVRRAVAGNAVGALLAGALLIGLGSRTDVYAALLAPVMLVAFTLGPLLGVAYAQALFTLVVATTFAQIGPVTWHLSEVRLIDVITGSTIGLLCGILAWPAGARREVHRAMAEMLRTCAQLVPVTAQTLLSGPGGSRSSPQALPAIHRLRLAEAAYAQYRSEDPEEETHTDWHAMLIAANRMFLGAYWLPRFGLRSASGGAAASAQARSTADELVAEANRIASLLTGGRTEPVLRRGVSDESLPSPLSADLEVWMTGLTHLFHRIESSLTPPPDPDGAPVTSSRHRASPPG